MKTGVVFGLISIGLGVAVAISGKRLCRTDCWIGNTISIFLPSSWKYLADAIPWIVFGVISIILAIFVEKHKK